MKKMRNGRRGFTLVEIVLVVAIIVILSSAAFFGVAATVNNAHEAQKNLSLNNANNFEAHARNQVDSIGKGQVKWDPIPYYTPENKAKDMKAQMLAEGWTEGEITFEYAEDGWHIIAEWDPTIEAHRGFQTPEDYKLWLSNYNEYLKMGYTEAEIEAGCKNGSTTINAVWNPDNHEGKTYEQYVASQQQGGNKPVNPDPVNPDPVNPDPVNPDPVNPDPVNPDPVNPGNPNPGSGAVSFSGSTKQKGNGVGNAVSTIHQNEDGSTTIGLVYSDWQVGTVQIWKNSDGTYDIHGVDGKISDVIGNAVSSVGGSPNWASLNSNTKYTLSPSEVAAIEKVYGIKFE